MWGKWIWLTLKVLEMFFLALESPPVMCWRMEKQSRRQLITLGTLLLSLSPPQEVNISQDCQWRYHNHSILNYDPHPSGEFLPFHLALTSLSAVWSIGTKYLSSSVALLKMGDHYCDLSSRTGEDSLSLVGQAILMYSRAALAGSPQVTDLLQL